MAPSTTANVQTAQPGASQLPVTGLNVIPLFVAGAVFLLAGFTVRRVNARPSPIGR